MKSAEIPLVSRPLPTAPRFPPPYEETYAELEPQVIANQTNRCCSQIFATINRVASLQLLFGIICLLGGILLTTESFPLRIYASLWASALFISTGVCGLISAKHGGSNHRWLIAFLVLSVLQVVAASVLAIFSLLNWLDAGTTSPLPLCVVPKHDAGRIGKEIYLNQNFDFSQCLYKFKLGVSFHSVLFIVAIIEGAE